jgi:hypothetical protein
LRDILNVTKELPKEECPPMNAISLPAFRRCPHTPTKYEKVFEVPDIRAHMEWSLIGTRGTVSPLHVDSDGLGTVVVILDGSKYWIVATQFGESHIICSIDSLGPNWNPYFVNEGNNAKRFRFEGIHLQKGDML